MTKHALLTCLLLFAIGCNGDFHTMLPNDYKLIYPNSSTVMIIAPAVRGESMTIIIPPRISQMAVNGNYVYGLCQYDPDADTEGTTPEPGRFKPKHLAGFFVLDTETGDYTTGLRKWSFIYSLKDKGIIKKNRLPPMKSPYRIK